MRPITATINLQALASNVEVVRRQVRGARIWAVVKADAYGHGLMRVLPALGSVDGLALLELDAAMQLRERGVPLPILLLEGFFSTKELLEFSRLSLTAVVHSIDQIEMLERVQLDLPIDVYFKINTGMNRLGFSVSAAEAVLGRLRSSPNVGRITLMTHFADADGSRGVSEQMSRMQGLIEGAGKGLPCSFANSAAILHFRETHADWVRPGIMLYGCTPFGEDAALSSVHFGLRPVMTLKSRIIAVQHVRPGERVGYGGTFTAVQAARIAIVAVGYADAYPRQAPGGNSGGTPILVAGQRARTVGRVSMDMLFVDVTALPEADVGTEVTLWGEGLSADEVATAAGTVSYEMLCALSDRVPVNVIA